MLPTHHCLPDEATSHAAAGSLSPVERVGNHTLAGWFGICVLTLLLLVPVLGGSVAFGSMVGKAAANYFLR